MSQLTPPGWQKAALDTLLWLLDPDPDKAWIAYLKLFKDIATYFSGSDSREIATQTLITVAEDVYLKLTGLRREDLDRIDIVHEVPRGIAPEVYEAERGRLPDLAIWYAKFIVTFQDSLYVRTQVEETLAGLRKLETEEAENRALKGLSLKTCQRALPEKVHFTAYYPRSIAML